MKNLFGAALALVLFGASQANADPCAAGSALSEGPVTVGFYEADVATGRRVCTRTELSLGGRAGATIDEPDFRGAIRAEGQLAGSYALSPERELFATLEVPRYEWVLNAVLESTSFSLGQLTAGATQRTFSGETFAGAVSARLMLPTSFATGNVRVAGAEVGHGLTYRPLEVLELHGYVGADFSAAISAGPAQPRLGGLLNAGVQYAPLRWFALALDLNGHVGGHSSYLAPALGLRFAFTDRIGAELAATAPLLGTERNLAFGALRFAYRFE